MFLPLSWKAPCYFLKKKHLGTWMIATWPCLSLDPHPSELFKSKKHADFCFSISVASLHMDFLHVSGLSKKNSIPPLKKTTKNTIPHQTSTHAMLNHLNLFWIDYPPSFNSSPLKNGGKRRRSGFRNRGKVGNFSGATSLPNFGGGIGH